MGGIGNFLRNNFVLFLQTMLLNQYTEQSYVVNKLLIPILIKALLDYSVANKNIYLYVTTFEPTVFYWVAVSTMNTY